MKKIDGRKKGSGRTVRRKEVKRERKSKRNEGGVKEYWLRNYGERKEGKGGMN